MKKSWLALALAITLLVPVSAKASPLDSFTNGFDDLVNPKTDVVVENGIPSEYEPEIRELETREVDEEQTVYQSITGTLSNISFTLDGAPVNLFAPNRNNQYYAIRRIFEVVAIPIAVALVFFWWGLRKTKQIIWTAFRTGRLNLGTSIKRAYYRRKAKEWYG